LLAVGLAACGSDNNDASSGGAGGDLTVSITEPQTLLPPNVQDAESVQPVSVMYTGLVSYDEKGGSVNEMADSIESTDNKTWTIKIKSGWKFDDGTDVTAQSYADAWNFGAYTPNAQVNQSYYSAIAGYDAVSTAKPAVKTMSGVVVKDPTTLEVTLTSPNAQWPATLGYQAFVPLAKACISDAKACAKKPIGNGPYKFVSWKNNQDLIVTKNPDYKGTAGKVDNIDFKIYSDQNTAFNDALAGSLDLQRGVPAERLNEAKKQTDRYLPVTLASTYQIGFPLYKKGSGYDDVKVRQAFSLSFNRQQIIDKLLDPTYTPATGILPPNFPAHEDNVCDVCKYDPAQAKKLIQEANFAGPLEVYTNGDTPLLKVYQAIASQSTQSLGIQVTIKIVPTFEQFLTLRQDQKVNGAFRAAWVADWPTPDNYLKNLFYTAAVGTSANDYAYSNKEVDSLIDQALQEPDVNKSNDLYKQAQRLILTDLPAVPLFWGGDQFFKAADVSNVLVTPFDIVRYAGISKG